MSFRPVQTFCHFDRSTIYSLALAQNRGFCAKEERQRSEVASRVVCGLLKAEFAATSVAEKSRSVSYGQKGSNPSTSPPLAKGEHGVLSTADTRCLAVRGERAQKRARAVTENGAFLTPFEKDGLRQQVEGGDLPLRDKVRLSESSVSRTPAAFLWGQTLPVYCAALSKPPPLAKGRLGVGRAIQPNFPMRRGAWGNLTELSAEYCRLILYTSN